MRSGTSLGYGFDSAAAPVAGGAAGGGKKPEGRKGGEGGSGSASVGDAVFTPSPA
jgi:hypothetical protein